MIKFIKKNKKIFLKIITYIIIGLSFFYVYENFKKNWRSLNFNDLKINIVYIVLSVISMLFAYLISTFQWRYTLNSISKKKISFLDAFFVVNGSMLAKYIPGKVGNVGLQIMWLDNLKYSVSSILFVNVIISMLGVAITFQIGLLLSMFSIHIINIQIAILLFLLIFIFELIIIFYNFTIFKKIIKIFNYFFKKDISYFYLPKKYFIFIFIQQTAYVLFYLLSMWLVLLGVNCSFKLNEIVPIFSVLLISEIIGFLFFIIPGGIGVREGSIIYFIRNTTIIKYTLIIPIITRILLILSESLTSLLTFIVYKYYTMKMKNIKK